MHNSMRPFKDVAHVCVQEPRTKTVVHTTEKIKLSEGGKEREINPERQRQLAKVAQVLSCLYSKKKPFFVAHTTYSEI